MRATAKLAAYGAALAIAFGGGAAAGAALGPIDVSPDDGHERHPAGEPPAPAPTHHQGEGPTGTDRDGHVHPAPVPAEPGADDEHEGH